MRSVMDQSSTRCPDGRAAATAIGGETPVTERVCCILVAGSSKIRFEEPNAARLPAQSRSAGPMHRPRCRCPCDWGISASTRSEEHTSELQSLMRIAYAVFFLKKKMYRT